MPDVKRADRDEPQYSHWRRPRSGPCGAAARPPPTPAPAQAGLAQVGPRKTPEYSNREGCAPPGEGLASIRARSSGERKEVAITMAWRWRRSRLVRKTRRVHRGSDGVGGARDRTCPHRYGMTISEMSTTSQSMRNRTALGSQIHRRAGGVGAGPSNWRGAKRGVGRWDSGPRTRL